jgi:L-lactate dehydrogenase complex protein LldG
MSARDNILNGIRSARGAVSNKLLEEQRLAEERIRTHPVSVRPSMNWERIERFKSQCVRMSSSVDDLSDRTQVPQAVARYLDSKQLARAAVCWPEIAQLDWASSGLNVVARPAQGNDLVGITGAYLGIAETGTLMFLSSPSTYPTTSLLPETHIAVVSKERIVTAMEEAWESVRREQGELPRAVNFVSGPSRTADIEGQLQLGAHGPFRVHVILVP